MSVFRAVISIALGIVLPLLVQLWDRRRLTAEQRERSWNAATWASALYAFGPLSMLGWIFVTRRRWHRCYLALAWTMPLLGALWALDAALQCAAGVGSEEPSALALLEAALGAAVGIIGIMLCAELITLTAGAFRSSFGSRNRAHDPLAGSRKGARSRGSRTR